MTECNFCNDNVSMPYTCSLCANRHCAKHRLPESHNCSNIGHFNTDAYRKLKIEKSRLPMNTITVGDLYRGQSYGGQPGTWTSGNINKDVLIAGIIIGIASVLRHFILNRDLLVTIGALTYGIVGLFMIFQWRNVFARRYDIVTTLVLWPIGIAITIITSLTPFRFFLFGYFINHESDSQRSEGIIGIVSTISILIVYSFGKILANTIDSQVTYGFSLASNVFLIFAVINVLPFNLFDGKKIWDWSRENYIFLIVFMIMIYFTVNELLI
ncbi:MAG: hypothetical protein HeimC2_01160 [Candidatus Heimdallarchaeota archaeon LC_2]|nr:MAG: hypothetical protein HeimC2_01160 [Candidatus Heimdallarchaeota archaeon LC_2]